MLLTINKGLFYCLIVFYKYDKRVIQISTGRKRRSHCLQPLLVQAVISVIPFVFPYLYFMQLFPLPPVTVFYRYYRVSFPIFLECHRLYDWFVPLLQSHDLALALRQVRISLFLIVSFSCDIIGLLISKILLYQYSISKLDNSETCFMADPASGNL